MNITGIIAEYNPFHYGHKWQLDEARRLSGGPVVVVMSGCFTQRGEPALCNKMARARMALLGGASVVLELPVFFACGGAEVFARGAVSLIGALGLDYLCFGAECDDLSILRQVAGILADEPVMYRTALKHHLSKGEGFAASRAKALREAAGLDSSDALEIIMRGPNNILAIEYLMSLRKLAPELVPLAVKRVGAGHDSPVPEGGFASASYLRGLVNTGKPGETRPYMPENAFNILAEEINNGNIGNIDKYSSLLHYILKTEKFKPQHAIYKNNRENESLWGHITKIAAEKPCISAIVDAAACKRFTKGRVRRAIMRRILNLPPENVEGTQRAMYARVLGFRREESGLLSHLIENSSIPIITNLKNAKKILRASAAPEITIKMHEQDLLAAEIYTLDTQGTKSEFSIPMVML